MTLDPLSLEQDVTLAFSDSDLRSPPVRVISASALDVTCYRSKLSDWWVTLGSNNLTEGAEQQQTDGGGGRRGTAFFNV